MRLIGGQKNVRWLIFMCLFIDDHYPWEYLVYKHERVFVKSEFLSQEKCGIDKKLSDVQNPGVFLKSPYVEILVLIFAPM